MLIFEMLYCKKIKINITFDFYILITFDIYI